MRRQILVILLVMFFAVSCQGQMEDSSLRGAKVGNKAYNFTLQDLDGNSVSLGDFEGEKVVLLVFSTTWCYYCQQEIPQLNRLKEQYPEEDFQVLAVYIRQSKNTVSANADQKGIQYTILLDDDGSVGQSYNVRGIPLNLLIDKEGVIRYRGHLPQDIDELIEELL